MKEASCRARSSGEANGGARGAAPVAGGSCDPVPLSGAPPAAVWPSCSAVARTPTSVASFRSTSSPGDAAAARPPSLSSLDAAWAAAALSPAANDVGGSGAVSSFGCSVVGADAVGEAAAGCMSFVGCSGVMATVASEKSELSESARGRGLGFAAKEVDGATRSAMKHALLSRVLQPLSKWVE